MSLIEYEKAKQRLRDHNDNRPFIPSLGPFDAKNHIGHMTEWINEKSEIEALIEQLEPPEIKQRRAEYSRREQIWLKNHYPAGVNVK